MQNQIVVHNQSVQDITAMAQAITKSGLFGIKTADQAVALMLVAQSEGRHPASVASEFDIIQGRPALKSQAALARFQAAGGKIQWVERTDSKASAKFSHAQGGELLVEWTIEQARDAGLTSKQTWKQDEPVPALPEPPKEIIVEAEPIQGEVIEWEADWFTPEVKATLADNAQVNAFLIGKNKIKESQTWRDITDKEYQKRINTGLARFVEAVEKAK